MIHGLIAVVLSMISTFLFLLCYSLYDMDEKQEAPKQVTQVERISFLLALFFVLLLGLATSH